MFSCCLSEPPSIAGAGEVVVRFVEAEPLPGNVGPGPLTKLGSSLSRVEVVLVYRFLRDHFHLQKGHESTMFAGHVASPRLQVCLGYHFNAGAIGP